MRLYLGRLGGLKKGSSVGVDDVKLVAGALGGDAFAFGMLVEKYRGLVVSMAYALLGDIHDAEDVAQDAFLKAYRRLAQLKEPEKFANWLSRITFGTVKDLQRRRARERATLKRLEQVMSREQISASLNDAGEAEKIVTAALAEMPDKFQVVLTMRLWGKKGYQEIADFLGTTKDVVRGLVYRGMKQLRERLRRYM